MCVLFAVDSDLSFWAFDDLKYQADVLFKEMRLTTTDALNVTYYFSRQTTALYNLDSAWLIS
jgi:antitoxin component of RelBE/YafQ-DinJ toxin-antitoxin module